MRTTTKLTRMGVMSVAKIYGLISAIFGLIFGAFLSLMSLFGGAMTMLSGQEGGAFGFFFGAAAIIILPIFYGIMGFIGGAISCWIYNLAAGWIGGVEMELEMPEGGQG